MRDVSAYYNIKDVELSRERQFESLSSSELFLMVCRARCCERPSD